MPMPNGKKMRIPLDTPKGGWGDLGKKIK
jgi:hypothetical protein